MTYVPLALKVIRPIWVEQWLGLRVICLTIRSITVTTVAALFRLSYETTTQMFGEHFLNKTLVRLFRIALVWFDQ